MAFSQVRPITACCVKLKTVEPCGAVMQCDFKMTTEEATVALKEDDSDVHATFMMQLFSFVGS